MHSDSTAAGWGTRVTEVSDEVAAAVRLQEGGAGVRRILAAVQRLAPVATRDVSRQVGIPVPLVTAVAGELRARGILAAGRPARLTAHGTALLTAHPAVAPDAWCAYCDGRGVAAPAALRPAGNRLAALQARAPEVELPLDQSYSTVDTKLRRVALLLGSGVLPAESVLLVGDDDLMSLSLVAAGAALGVPLAHRIAVVDISTPLLEFLRASLPAGAAELYAHDLRDPLPARLRHEFEVAVTDPPYTVPGARLFLSRAVEGLRAGSGRAVVFSFGPKGPNDTLAVQRAVTEIGLATQATYRGFNEYLGTGVLGGTSHLHWLATTDVTASALPGPYSGPLYTADTRRPREYRCQDCGARTVVGAGGRWASARVLREAGCPACGGHRFRPLRLVAAG